eukprot:CAMPEP_0119003528 /NCGR_PEP_ID=MMETSP1176-20130426/615_1 /TAXON_ID=265551 /ORGANISM="Synedropsis recta cf, Strain CCMP1620" /LENGTH=121 /DNA_ID=CAMNT_0006955139 /DNA_START=58 /DNA_END=423 /DNA_ORIENTATION=-
MTKFVFLLSMLFALASVASAMEGDWMWEKTSWWRRKKDEMGHNLKKCVFIQHVAQTGDHCPGVAKHDYYCMFGTAWECEGDEAGTIIDSEPEWICMCNEETWMFECGENKVSSTCETDGSR